MSLTKIDRLWKRQGGIDPKTGKAWLTPRMKEQAARIVELWRAEPCRCKRDSVDGTPVSVVFVTEKCSRCIALEIYETKS